MDFDPKDILDFLQATASSVGAEASSPWFYLQFGLMMAAAGIALAADAAIRARVDMTKLAMRWPLPLRHFARILVSSASTSVFAILVIAARVTMYHSTWPSRSYLLMVAAKLALAWLVIRLFTSVISNAFIVRVVSLSAWLIAALSILGQLDPTVDLLDSDQVSVVLGGLRLTPLVLIKFGALLIVALWLTNIVSNFAQTEIIRSSDLTPSQISVVLRLEKDGSATVSSLARTEGMRPQSMSAVVTPLQELGLVRGVPDPSDGRQTLMLLTPKCLKLLQEGRAARQDWLTTTISQKLSTHEQVKLQAALELLTRLVED